MMNNTLKSIPLEFINTGMYFYSKGERTTIQAIQECRLSDKASSEVRRELCRAKMKKHLMQWT